VGHTILERENVVSKANLSMHTSSTSDYLLNVANKKLLFYVVYLMR